MATPFRKKIEIIFSNKRKIQLDLPTGTARKRKGFKTTMQTETIRKCVCVTKEKFSLTSLRPTTGDWHCPQKKRVQNDHANRNNTEVCLCYIPKSASFRNSSCLKSLSSWADSSSFDAAISSSSSNLFINHVLILSPNLQQSTVTVGVGEYEAVSRLYIHKE